jgi:hypothetical protein
MGGENSPQNKYQYSMTKTFTAVVSHRFVNPSMPAVTQLGTTVDGIGASWRLYSTIRFRHLDTGGIYRGCVEGH